MKTYLLWFFFYALISCEIQENNPIIGRVVAIIDGDTIVVLDEKMVQHKIRVASIDCPEYQQPFSKEAKKFTSNEVFGKTVRVNWKEKDRYGRKIGFVYYDLDKNLSEELLKAGYAWHLRRYSDDWKLQDLEDKAHNKRIGLWKDVTPTPPWEWRKIFNE